MSTAEMEVETAEIAIDSSTLQPVADAAEAPGEPDPEEIARAEAEGMVDVEPPKVERTAKEALEDAERLTAIAKAADEVDFYEKTATEKRSIYVIAAEKAKDAKKAAEAADDDLRQAARRHRLLREGEQPDPDRYPLYDKVDDKSRIDGMFPKPEAIPPEPANLEAFQNWKARETKLADLGFGKRIMGKFEAAGYVTLADLRDKSPEALGLTEKQREEMDEAMTLFWVEANKTYQADHPEAAAEDAGATLGDGQHPPDADPYDEDLEDQGHEYDGMEGGDS